jgi:hypothetical protein
LKYVAYCMHAAQKGGRGRGKGEGRGGEGRGEGLEIWTVTPHS